MIIGKKAIEREIAKLWGRSGLEVSFSGVVSIGNRELGFVDVSLSNAELALPIADLSARVLQPALSALRKHNAA